MTTLNHEDIVIHGVWHTVGGALEWDMLLHANRTFILGLPVEDGSILKVTDVTSNKNLNVIKDGKLYHRVIVLNTKEMLRLDPQDRLAYWVANS